MKAVFTGWRTLTPGTCLICGSEEDWECDGRGVVFCSCQACPECSEHDGHAAGCSELRPDHEHKPNREGAYYSIAGLSDGFLDLYYPCAVEGCTEMASYGVSIERVLDESLAEIEESCWS